MDEMQPEVIYPVCIILVLTASKLNRSRVLDPILYDLLDPSILRTSTTFKVRGREISGFLYERPYDQRFVNYLLETLLSVVSFGGQGFTKATRTSAIKRSHHTGLVQRVSNSKNE